MRNLLVLAASVTGPQEVVEEIAHQIVERYVLVDEAPRIAEHLLEKAFTGAYDRLRAEDLAQVLTADLRALGGDLHFAVAHDPELAQRLLAAGAGVDPKLPELGDTSEELEHKRRTNFGFARAEILAGNIGLVELTRFDALEIARETAAAAMAFVAGTDALIFDLRANGGGRGDTVSFLVSYFLPGGVELMASFDRETGETQVGRTLAELPGKRRPELPLFVLIGPATGSAAEAFAFTLQRLGRATLVGETSAGAAQGGGWVPVGEGFVVFIPTFRPFDPHKGDNWQGTGVPPDVPAPVARALELAHLHAVEGLAAASPRRELRWLLPLLHLAAHGPAPCDPGDLPGRYAGIEVSTAAGALKFLGASGILRDLTPLADGTFLIEDSSVPVAACARLRFVRAPDGAIEGLELLTAEGDVLRRARL